MNKEIIVSALNEALHLINSESESIELVELKEEYYRVIQKIEIALIEIEK